MARNDRIFLAAFGDTIELQWTGEDDLEFRTVNTVAHAEDIAFLNEEDAELEDCIAQLQELDRIRHNHLG